jgi:mannosylglucosylglycerate synthase
MDSVKNIGFISTRFAGTDGVSLETAKWADFFENDLQMQCFYMAGELDTPPDRSFLVEEASFNHPGVKAIGQACFGVSVRDPEVTLQISRLKEILKIKIREFINKFKLEILVVENALTIPMNLPLGIALTEVISETGIQTIAHHHDFFWERQRFLVNAVWEYLNMAFPPHLPSIQHVVINSSADNQLSLRTGISATIIPNVMDFDNPPPQVDEYASDVRQSLGIAPDELLVLQPTRVVKRKGIEHAIELVKRLQRKAVLVISHASGDEGNEYEKRLRAYARMMDVRILFTDDVIKEFRGTTPDGRKVYTLEDIYPHADLVTYPSNIEGFGNAFLETIYHKKPIVVNLYSIYRSDIKPMGFDAIEIDGYVTEEALQRTREILSDQHKRDQMVNKNFNLGKRYFSYRVLHRRLKTLLSEVLGENHNNSIFA